jgi:hypothetical protein
MEDMCGIPQANRRAVLELSTGETTSDAAQRTAIFSGRRCHMEPDVRIFEIPPDAGNPVDAFFPEEDVVHVVYEEGYTCIPLSGKSRDSGWRVTVLFGPTLGGMMRVCFWDADAQRDARAWREALLVEVYGEVGDVHETRIVGHDSLRIGPARVAAVHWYRGTRRALTLLREEGKDLLEELSITDRAVAFCSTSKEGAELDVVVVRDSFSHNEGLGVRFTKHGVERYRLPSHGTVELGYHRAAILNPSGEVFLATPLGDVARRVASGALAVGLSPDGDRLVMLRQEANGWVWDFRTVSRLQDSFREQAVLPKVLEVERAIIRISPSLRWAVGLSPEHAVVWPVPKSKIWT